MIKCHFGPPWGHLGTHGGPQMAQNSTKMAYNCPKSLEWPKISLHDPKCLCGPKTVLRGIIHAYMPFWTTLLHPWGPQKGLFWPKKVLLGAPDIPWGQICHWLVQLCGLHPYHVLGPLKRPLRHSWGPKRGPFWPKRVLLRAPEVLGQPWGA